MTFDAVSRCGGVALVAVALACGGRLAGPLEGDASSGGSGGTTITGGSGGAQGARGSSGAGTGGSSSACAVGGDLNCDYKVAGYEFCYSYSGLSSAEISAEKAACLAEPRASTPACCPTAGKTGCCEKIPLRGTSIRYGYCIYGSPAGDDSAFMSACDALKGTWSG